MGVFDRFKRGLRKSIEQQLPAVKSAPRLVLDVAHQDRWAQQCIDELDLDGEFEDFEEDVLGLLKRIDTSLAKFTDEGILQAIPERARTINELHGHEYAAQTRKLLKKAQFTGLFELEGEIAGFMAANQEYQDLTNKNVAALREFMHDELKETQGLLQQLEDRIIAMGRFLEEKKFPLIRQIRDARAALVQMEERRGKYQQLSESLREDLARTQDRIGKMNEKIRQQRELIRNEEALAALERLTKVEEDLAALAARYLSAAHDVVKYYRRYPHVTPPRSKRVIDELSKEQARLLAGSGAQVREALAEVAEHLENEGQGNTRSLADRLKRLAEGVDDDAHKVQELLEDQRALRQSVMRDVAALAIYDQQQFLIKARQDEAEIERKLEFLAAELDPAKRIEHERAMKDAALALGATITGEKIALPQDGMAAEPKA